MSRTVINPSLSSGNSSPNPFDAYTQSQMKSNSLPQVSDPANGGRHHNLSPHSPPPASNGDASLTRHHLETAIPERPSEEESLAELSGEKRSSYHKPSPLSQAPTDGHGKVRSSSGSTDSAETASVTKLKKDKHQGLLRKLSGMNIFHHSDKHHSDKHHADKHHADKHHAEQVTAHVPSTAERRPREIKPVRVTSAPRPGDPMQTHLPTTNYEKPRFTMGESAANSRRASPNVSALPSRAPSAEVLPANTKVSRAPSIAASSVASTEGGHSPVRDHEDFIARAPDRSNSTFNFNRAPGGMQNHSPPRRASSFAVGDTTPITIPGVAGPDFDSPVGSLSRTLSKTSLAGGMGWGTITDKLPTFDSLYTWKDSSDRKIKVDLSGKSCQIGEGAGGVIRTARLKDKCHPAYHPESRGGDLGLFAVKTFRKQSEKESEGWYCQKLVREFRVHCALKHDNIVKLADICIEHKKFAEAQFVAVLDFCVGGDVFDLHYHPWNSIDQGIMSKVERNCIFKQLMFAVNYMHAQGIAHRDIKLENMLVNGHGQLKLADFGTSNFTKGPDAEACRGFVGTDHSVSPEIFLSSMSTSSPKPAYDGCKADIWACAVAWHLLTWSNDEPKAALRAYPFGPEGADPENKAWQRYMNSYKRYEPSKHIPGWDLYLRNSNEPPSTPTLTTRQSSIALSASSQTGRTELDAMFDTSDPNPPSSTDDLKDPLRKCRPFATGYPGSGFTAAKGMLDPDPETRWTARQVLEDSFFALIDCCQQDSFAEGYDSSRERQRKGLQKVHNHIRPTARKLMEMNKVEQHRNQELVNSKRSEQITK